MTTSPPLLETVSWSTSSSPALSIFGDEEFREGQEVPAVTSTSTAKAKSTKSGTGGPGVVYVGRIPHGFYEHEMRAYFSQFGTITRLRLSRNRNTGASKHYAFIEFASAEVASIVAGTMNSYLLFGHILRCKVVPPEQVHEKLWVGANRRFKKVPWNRIEGRKLNLPMGRERWERRLATEKKRRGKKNKGLESIGYEGPVGNMREVDDVFVRKEENNEEVLALEPGNSTEEVVQEEKSVNSGSGDGLPLIREGIKRPKVSRSKRKDKASELEQEDQQHRVDPTSIIKDSECELQPSKGETELEELSVMQKVSGEKQLREGSTPITKVSGSKSRPSKRKAVNEKSSEAKKVRRKKVRSD